MRERATVSYGIPLEHPFFSISQATCESRPRPSVMTISTFFAPGDDRITFKTTVASLLGDTNTMTNTQYTTCVRPLVLAQGSNFHRQSTTNFRLLLYQRHWTLACTTQTMTMTMTHSEKSHICQMKAWPYRQECRGHDPMKKNLLCC